MSTVADSTISSIKNKNKRQNYYDSDIDFKQLAAQDQGWRAIFKENERLDWQDAGVVQELTKAILRVDFDLELTLPDDRLCPPVPVRWNYVRWLQDLLDTTIDKSDHNNDDSDSEDEEETTGLDIGVGASCIYSLLICSSRPNWRMLGTDIDSHSLTYAQKNVTNNNFTNRIRLKQTTQTSPLLPLDSAGIDSIDFVMCNPPFYSSEEDMARAYGMKAMPPSAVCSGSANEMICEDGDIGFATRILDESLQLRDRVRWYSCMFGRLASAQQLVAKLKENGINNFAATNLRAGQKTVRWAIAWSFSGVRPPNDIARHGDLVREILPPATERTMNAPDLLRIELAMVIDSKMRDLDVNWSFKKENWEGVMTSLGNVWSRSARRKKKFKPVLKGEEQEAERIADTRDVLGVRLRCVDHELHITWLKGHDPVLLESFCGMLKVTLGLRNGMT